MIDQKDLLAEQREFALKMMEMEHVVPVRRKVVVVRTVKRPVKKVRRYVLKTPVDQIAEDQQSEAEDRKLKEILKNYSEAVSRTNARRALFDTSSLISFGEMTGIGKVDEEKEFVQFLVQEKRRVDAWIAEQHFPETQETDEDREDESRERMVIAIYRNHRRNGLTND